MIQTIRDLKKGDIAQTAGKIFRDSSTPRLEVLMRAKGSEEELSEEVITEVSQFKNRLKR